MQSGRWALALAALAWLGAAAQDVTGEALPPIPGKDPQETFKYVSAQWRDYFIRASEAERFDDPLQRCLAYPDLPGNRWPEGHAAAHCRFHALEPLALADFEDRLERGEAAALDELLDRLLAKHFAEGGDGEDIHVAIGAFSDANADTDRVSARWLELAPASAYAHLARANYYRDAAWNARGGKWASETPRESLRRMTDMVDQAVPLFRRAIRIEPRLMPAYAGLLNVAMLDSRPGVEREALTGAAAQDPACLEIARLRMNALQPRWGGSYEEMLSYAAELSKHVARRPQLAIHVAAPYADRGDRLIAGKEYSREAAEVLDIAVRIGSNEGAMRGAADVALNPAEGEADRWKGAALLLQEHRFNETNAWAHRQIAWQLVKLAPEWSMRHALKAAELDPENAFGQYLLGAGHYNTRQFEQAERHYLAAVEDAGLRRTSLRELSTMWLYDSGLERRQAAVKAKPYIDRLLQAYPDDGGGWAMRLDQAGLTEGYVDLAIVREFLRHADRKDSWQAQRATHLETELAKHGAPPEQWRP